MEQKQFFWLLLALIVALMAALITMTFSRYVVRKRKNHRNDNHHVEHLEGSRVTYWFLIFTVVCLLIFLVAWLIMAMAARGIITL